MVRFYKSIVVPLLEEFLVKDCQFGVSPVNYSDSDSEDAAAVCQSGKCGTLDRIQQRGVAMSLGVPIIASLEDSEVNAEVLSLDLIRGELIVREFGKTCAKQDTQPIAENPALSFPIEVTKAEKIRTSQHGDIV